MGRHGVGGWGCASLLTWALTVTLTVSTRVVTAQSDSQLASFSQSTSIWQVSGFESTRRHLLFVSGNESAVHPLVVRSRVDPSNGFKDYKGGYNVTNSHYWASAAFIAVGAYIVALAWLLLGLLLTCLACCRCCLVPKPRSNRSCVAYVAIILFSLVSIGGSILLYAGDISANDSINSVVHTLDGAVQDTVGQVHNVTAAGDAVAVIIQPTQPSLAAGITTSTLKLNAAAARVQERVGNSTGSISALRDDIKWTLVGVSAFYLLLLLLSAVAIPCSWTTLLLALAVLGWVAVALTLCVCGLYITAHMVVIDSCSAMREYNVRLGPTTLDALLPCVDLMATQTTVMQLERTAFHAGESTQTLLNTIGKNGNTSLSPICNPFLGPPGYGANTSCPPSQITDLPKVLLPLTCPDNTIQNSCLQQRQIVPNNTYTTLSTYSMAVSRILMVLPEVDNLLNCTFVTATFDTLVRKDCHNAESSLRITWVALIILAVSMMILSPLWLFVYSRVEDSSALQFRSLEMRDMNDRVGRREKRNVFRES